MPRTPKVRYFPSRKAYYTQFKGKQHKLAEGPKDGPTGPTFLAATSAYRAILEQDVVSENGACNTVKTICNVYLENSETKIRKSSFATKRAMLKVLVQAHGHLMVADIKVFHLEKIAQEMKKPRMKGKRRLQWCDSQVHLFFAHVKACFAWAVKTDLIPKNPFKALEMPSVRICSRERIVTPEEHQMVLTFLRLPRQHALKRMIVALEHTGARPGELRNARVKDYNRKLGAIIYQADSVRNEDEFAHKTSKRKQRNIYFTGDRKEWIEELIAGKKPNDFIFSNRFGRQYRGAVLDESFRSIKEKLNLPHYVPYAYRHTLATNWLLAKRSIELLAAILGNSAATIRKHYAHLLNEHDALRGELEAFRQAK